jgi:Spy/CpxP family protein refolding chaperone
MTKAVIIFGFLIAFAAGLVVGLRPCVEAQPPPPRPSRHGGWLAAELDLTAEQREQMDAIWSEIAFRGRHEREEQRRELLRQRDEAIVSLIRPEDQPKYEAHLAEHAEQMDALEREWRDAFKSAVEQTKAILTPEQQARYERMLQRGPSERGRSDWRRGDRGRGLDRKQASDAEHRN